jgi:hypothetical protein
MDTTTTIQDTVIKVVKVMTNNETTIPQTICCSFLILLAIILLTGLIGGIINYLTNYVQPPKDNEVIKPFFYKDRQFYLQILLGICGAGLIPLLLYFTSSKLFERCDDCYFPYFVFSGYCLIGAIFSRAMLKSLAKRLDLEKFQEDLNKQKEELKTVKGEVKEAGKFIENKLEEEQQEATNDLPKTVETKSETIKENMTEKPISFTDTDLNTYIKEKADTEMEAILNDLQKSKYKDRSIQGISKTTKIHENNVTIIIRAFVRVGIVDEVKWYGKTFYRLTQRGKEAKLIK